MYFLEYLVGSPPPSDLMLEFNQPMAGQMQAGKQQIPGFPPASQPNVAPSSGLVEFEDIKKYILYGKLKEIKLKLETSNVNRQNPDVLNMFEFLDTLLLFYNTFTYEEAQRLIDALLETVSSVLKIKTPAREFIDKPLDPSMVQQIQTQQQQAQQQAEDDAKQTDLDQQKMDLEKDKIAHNLAKDKTRNDLDSYLHSKSVNLARRELKTTKQELELKKNTQKR